MTYEELEKEYREVCTNLHNIKEALGIPSEGQQNVDESIVITLKKFALIHRELLDHAQLIESWLDLAMDSQNERVRRLRIDISLVAARAMVELLKEVTV